MTQSLDQISDWADAFLKNLSSAEVRKLAKQIAQDLRRSNQRRIDAQVSPTGTPYVPRKNKLRKKKGRIRRKMFSGLRQARHLAIKATGEGATVGYLAAKVAKIAETHHLGKSESIRLGKKTFTVQYPERQLIGFNDQDIDSIRSRLLALIEKAAL